MPTDAQIKAREGSDPITEPFAVALSLQSTVKREPGAWESVEHETRQGFRRQADDWVERALVGGIGLGDLPRRAPGGLM